MHQISTDEKTAYCDYKKQSKIITNWWNTKINYGAYYYAVGKKLTENSPVKLLINIHS